MGRVEKAGLIVAIVAAIVGFFGGLLNKEVRCWTGLDPRSACAADGAARTDPPSATSAGLPPVQTDTPPVIPEEIHQKPEIPRVIADPPRPDPNRELLNAWFRQYQRALERSDWLTVNQLTGESTSIEDLARQKAQLDSQSARVETRIVNWNIEAVSDHDATALVDVELTMSNASEHGRAAAQQRIMFSKVDDAWRPVSQQPVGKPRVLEAGPR
jgi:hypothetical protein